MQQSKKKSSEVLGRLLVLGWLAEQPGDFQERIAAAGRWTNVPRRRLLYASGDQPNALFGLGEGLLDLSIPIGNDEEVTFYRAGPGFWIGEASLLAETSRAITLETATDCRIFRISTTALHHMLAEHPEDWVRFFRLSYMNTALALRVHAEVLSLRPTTRFARMLLRLASPDGLVRVTQEDLGRMAGMSRAAFRRSFAALIESGAVHTEYGAVKITDRTALQRVAELTKVSATLSEENNETRPGPEGTHELG